VRLGDAVASCWSATGIWNNVHTTIDEVWYYPIENQSTELQRYRANALDMNYDLPEDWRHGPYSEAKEDAVRPGAGWDQQVSPPEDGGNQRLTRRSDLAAPASL
jgi:hypothetical protein